ncbi:MAG: hypothetical protein GYA12_05480 [Chloroflexi bacterium]|nr:hypothetical protein [Chloroflexota bacterium]BCY16397.1 hypothetical protein hrd7_02460 [Leptolinea sp. HRD-7]
MDARKAENKLCERKISSDAREFIDPVAQVLGDTAFSTYRFLSTTPKPDGSISKRISWNGTEVYVKKNGL